MENRYEHDLISRTAALEAIGEKPLAWTEGEYELGLQNQWSSDVDAINGLPSIQIDIITCKDCVKKDRCRFYEFQGDTGYCRYGKDKDGRLNPQTRRD